MLYEAEPSHDIEKYPSAWEINHELLDCAIPVVKIVHTKAGEKYAEYKNNCFLMSKKLRGSNISDMKDDTIAWKMGRAIAQLHTAFVPCETEDAKSAI